MTQSGLQRCERLQRHRLYLTGCKQVFVAGREEG
jgi:hypothetical protein